MFLGIVLVVLGVVLEQVELVAQPLLVPMQKKLPPGPQKKNETRNETQNGTRNETINATLNKTRDETNTNRNTKRNTKQNTKQKTKQNTKQNHKIKPCNNNLKAFKTVYTHIEVLVDFFRFFEHFGFIFYGLPSV